MKHRFLRWIFLRIPLLWVALSLVLVLILKYVPVYYTPLMIRRAVEYRDDGKYEFHRKWVPLERISPNMMKAVIASEDNLFASHKGFDTEEMKRMFKAHVEKGKKIRGCSTISQQTAKNVFTSGSQTWLRKAVEAWFTVLIEKIWGKERIMEVYLNVAETGLGIYGVQAAAKVYYGIDASALSLTQSVDLALCLPSPIKRTPSYVHSHMATREKAIISLTGKVECPEWVKNQNK